MISTSGISLSYGKRVIFKDVSIKFTPGNCYGLIGANGSGKSTFLKILAGEIEPDHGEVSIGARERIAVLRQDHFAFDEHTVLDTVIMGHARLHALMRRAGGDLRQAGVLRGGREPRRRAGGGVRRAQRLRGGVRGDGAAQRPRHPDRVRAPADEDPRGRATRCACSSPRRCSTTRTSCCSTNRPTTWTSSPSPGWRSSSPGSRTRSSSSPTTATSSTRSARTSRTSTSGRSSSTSATTTSGTRRASCTCGRSRTRTPRRPPRSTT